jgi:hypothetical protein
MGQISHKTNTPKLDQSLIMEEPAPTENLILEDHRTEILILKDRRTKEKKKNDEEKENAEIAEIATETNYYHCHKTCVNYVTPCRSPDKCKQQKQENKPCPIKKILGEHMCGDIKLIPKIDYNRFCRVRRSDLHWNSFRFLRIDGDDVVKYRESRDYVHNIGDAIKVHYAEVDTIEIEAEEIKIDGHAKGPEAMVKTKNTELETVLEEKRHRVAEAVAKAKEILKEKELEEEKL